MPSEEHPARRQCLPAQNSHKDDTMADSKHSANSTVTDPEILKAPLGLLESQIRELLHYDPNRANCGVKLLDSYLDMWEFYVIKSAEMIRLEEEHRRLQEFNDCLVGECDILLQCFEEQGLVLHDRRQAVRALQNGVISALHASDPQPFPIYGLEQDPAMVHDSNGHPGRDIQI